MFYLYDFMLFKFVAYKYTKMNNTKKIHHKNIFNESHYKSNDGMLTSIWGPSLWHVLHTMSFNYPTQPSKDEKIHYRDFILNLKYTLPCGKCRENLKKNIKELPLQMKNMDSRETFSKYVYDLHELVNKMLGKKSGLSFEEIKDRYEHFRARCVNEKIQTKLENGCIKPLYGKKSKCILKIVPADVKCETLEINKECMKYT